MVTQFGLSFFLGLIAFQKWTLLEEKDFYKEWSDFLKPFTSLILDYDKGRGLNM